MHDLRSGAPICTIDADDDEDNSEQASSAVCSVQWCTGMGGSGPLLLTCSEGVSLLPTLLKTYLKTGRGGTRIPHSRMIQSMIQSMIILVA